MGIAFQFKVRSCCGCTQAPPYGAGPEDCPTCRKGALGTPSPEGPALVETLQYYPGVKHALATLVTAGPLAVWEDLQLVHNRGPLGSLDAGEHAKEKRS